MKNLLILTAFFLFSISFLQAQAPQSFNYQAVARDADNNPYQNTTLGIRISLVRDNPNGASDFIEEHQVLTSDLGVFTLQIGKGIPFIGNLTNVDWGSHSYYLQVEMDPSGGTNYLDMGVTQLLSVPYALYAGTAGDDEDDLDTDPTNEIQTITLNGNNLSLSGGGGLVILPEDSDNQTLNLQGTTLLITDGNGVDLSSLQDGNEDADADPANELQALSFDITTNELSLSNGNSISIPTGGTDADANPLNEIQSLTLNGNILTLSEDGGSVNLSGLQDGVNDADSNPTNEIQNISKSGNTVTLSNGGGSFTDAVNDADANASNELQNITLSGNALTLSNGGGTVQLPSGGSSLWSENEEGIDYSEGNVGINTDAPFSALEVYNDESDFEAGYFYISNSNNDYSALAGITEGTGSGILGSSSGDGPGGFFENNDDSKLALQTGFGSVGIGTDEADARMEIKHNSTSSDPTLLLRESANDFARLDFRNTFNGNKKWSVEGYLGNSEDNSKLNFQYKEDGYVGQDRMTILGNGNVGIDNDDPDQALVIGKNIGEGWNIPAITVGNNAGGAIQVGNDEYSVSIDAAEPYNRIASNSPDGFGLAEVEMRTAGMAIGESPGSPGGYMLAVVHEDYGFLIEREGTFNNWEFYAVDNPNYNLNLFSGGLYRGEFDGTTGEYFSVSDRSLKQNIKPMEGVLDKVMKLETSRYEYKDNNPIKKQSIGFIAQDVKKLFPELVSVSEDKRSEGTHAVNYAGFGTVAIKAIQEQQTQIDSLSAENENLKAEMAEQKKKAEELEARLARLEKLLEK
jgi:hypothetical protein